MCHSFVAVLLGAFLIPSSCFILRVLDVDSKGRRLRDSNSIYTKLRLGGDDEFPEFQIMSAEALKNISALGDMEDEGDSERFASMGSEFLGEGLSLLRLDGDGSLESLPLNRTVERAKADPPSTPPPTGRILDDGSDGVPELRDIPVEVLTQEDIEEIWERWLPSVEVMRSAAETGGAVSHAGDEDEDLPEGFLTELRQRAEVRLQEELEAMANSGGGASKEIPHFDSVSAVSPESGNKEQVDQLTFRSPPSEGDQISSPLSSSSVSTQAAGDQREGAGDSSLRPSVEGLDSLFTGMDEVGEFGDNEDDDDERNEVGLTREEQRARQALFDARCDQLEAAQEIRKAELAADTLQAIRESADETEEHVTRMRAMTAENIDGRQDEMRRMRLLCDVLEANIEYQRLTADRVEGRGGESWGDMERLVAEAEERLHIASQAMDDEVAAMKAAEASGRDRPKRAVEAETAEVKEEKEAASWDSDLGVRAEEWDEEMERERGRLRRGGESEEEMLLSRLNFLRENFGSSSRGVVADDFDGVQREEDESDGGDGPLWGEDDGGAELLEKLLGGSPDDFDQERFNKLEQKFQAVRIGSAWPSISEDGEIEEEDGD
uniref:Uncharacterized protein n=1 Tax=Chromera velia CCMP2878 TaxID=1169474 RepID=A0A0G4FS19_9ALVE|eukprot:Cvel_18495.t1-p1 / transcript=Cvel_18495.t1 / gene=Cvel_18495 / organism=Chromera_velia_CCMP2878 / gene_product=hypothetical protein / transcript_product=hypothetical protein / location=Cvel_scaffold1535:11775-14156(-) / protein_length=606 / sequence_SO=supercontig / SO=protein_coding / is_pseudo=false